MANAVALEAAAGPAVLRAAPARQRSLWGDAFRRLIRNRLALFGLGVAVAFFLLGLFGPLLTPYDHLRQNLLAVEQPPTLAHPLGTDELGRDLLSRIMQASRTAVLVATLVTTVTLAIGILVGATAAFAGGWVDYTVSRVVDILMSFPHLLLAIFVNATIKPPVAALVNLLYERTRWGAFSTSLLADYLVVFGALALVGWSGIARLIRGQILSLRERDYVVAARALGAPPRWIVAKHLVPNALGPVIVAATIGFGNALLLEASLSYLGIGIQPPGASLGAMINENLAMWRYKPHLVIFPASVVAIVLYGFSTLGDGLNDALNPRAGRR